MQTIVQKLVASIAAQRLRRAEEMHAQFRHGRRRQTSSNTVRPLPHHLRFA